MSLDPAGYLAPSAGLGDPAPGRSLRRRVIYALTVTSATLAGLPIAVTLADAMAAR